MINAQERTGPSDSGRTNGRTEKDGSWHHRIARPTDTISGPRRRGATMAANLMLAGAGGLCSLAFLYFLYHYSWTGDRQFTSAFGPLIYYVVPASLSVLFFLSLRLRPGPKATTDACHDLRGAHSDGGRNAAGSRQAGADDLVYHDAGGAGAARARRTGARHHLRHQKPTAGGDRHARQRRRCRPVRVSP